MKPEKGSYANNRKLIKRKINLSRHNRLEASNIDWQLKQARTNPDLSKSAKPPLRKDSVITRTPTKLFHWPIEEEHPELNELKLELISREWSKSNNNSSSVKTYTPRL